MRTALLPTLLALAVAFIVLRPQPVHAACVRTGDAVVCSGFTGNSFVSPDPGLDVQILPGAQIKNFASSALDGACGDPDFSLPALALGNRAHVINAGALVGTGTCGAGIAVDNNAIIDHRGSIVTSDTLGHGILAGDTARITATGSIQTFGRSAFGIVAGDDAQIQTAAGSLINTAGIAAIGLLAGDRALIKTAGQIFTADQLADGVSVGAAATVANAGQIVVTGTGASALRALGDAVRLNNSGLLSAVNLGRPTNLPGAGVTVHGANAQIVNSGTITGSFAGLALSVAGTSTLDNSGALSGGGERGVDGALLAGGGVVIDGSGLVNLNNTGTIIGAAGLPAVRSTVPLMLVSRGEIDGDIRLSAGDDFVILGSGGNLRGTLDGGAGLNRLVLDGTGTVTGDIVGISALSKVNPGTWTLAGTVAIGGDVFVTSGILAVAPAGQFGAGGAFIEAGATLSGHATISGALTNDGTLAVDGAGFATVRVGRDYVQSGTGALRLRVGATGQDQLIVGGTAILGGTLTIVPTARLRDGQTFALLSGAHGPLSVSGAFLPLAATTFLRPELRYGPDGVTLLVHRLPYATAAATEAGRALAEVLDRQQTPSAALAPMLDALDGQTPAAAATTLSHLAPETIPSAAVLADRGLAALMGAVADATRGPERNVWASFMGRDGAAAGRDVAPYRYHLQGAVAGAVFAPGLGFAIAHVDATARFSSSATLALPMTFLGLSARAYWPGMGTILQAQMAYGAGHAASQRLQTLPTLGDRSLHSEGDVHVVGFTAEARRTLVAGPVELQPHAGLALLHGHLAAFDEGTSLGLATQAAETTSLRPDLGLVLQRGGAAFGPFGAIDWQPELLPARLDLPARLIDAADAAFVLPGARLPRNIVEASGGFAGRVLPGVSLRLLAATAIGQSLAGHRIELALNCRW